MYLTNAKNKKQFCHVDGKINEELQTELTRLNNHPLITLHDICYTFLNTKPNKLSLLLMNIQSFSQHFKDLISDDILSSINMIALTETWANNIEKNSLTNYDCITQNKRIEISAAGTAFFQKQNTIHSKPLEIQNINNNRIGDICAVFFESGKLLISLIIIYVSPNKNKNEIKQFLLVNLKPLCNCDKFIICGDFNINVIDGKNRDFIEFMENSFHCKLFTNTSTVGLKIF